MTAWAAAAPAVAHVLVEGPLADVLEITGPDGHHLERVRRLRVDEPITAADGSGQWRAYRVEATRRGALTLHATGALQSEPTQSPPLAVAFALTKGEKPETVVARLTELGVDRILPVIAHRSVARWKGRQAEARLERLERVAREAAMQCRRARLPGIAPPAPVGSLAGRPGLVLADRGDDPAEALPEPGPEGWLLLVGPEGGFEPEEVEVLGPVARLAVGPHILRAETAAVAAAAILVRQRTPRNSHGGWADRGVS